MRIDERIDEQVALSRTYGRRTVLRAGVGASALVSGGLLDCRRAAASLQTPSAGLPEDAAAEQVFRVQMGSAGSGEFNFQPLQSGGDQTWWVSFIRLPPLYFDVDLNPQPAIFDTWQPNDDSTIWTFTIDPRAIWSDGSPITAADVKGTWELMANPILENSRVGGYLGGVVGFADLVAQSATDAAGLVVVDDRTLEVRLDESDPLFHWRIATVHLVPVKIDQAGQDPENFWQPENTPVSSGPYILESFDPDQGTAAMVKNPNWWMAEGQYLDRIEIRFVTDPGTVALMVRNNELDATQQDLPLDLKSQFPSFFQAIRAFGFDVFWLVPTVEPTSDINVRKALTLSVNFEDVFRAAFPQGGAQPANQFLDADFPCIETERTWYPYDPAAAQAALAASAYGSAEGLPRLRVTPRGVNPFTNRALESVIEFWRQNLGITNVQFEQQPDAFGASIDQINLTRDDLELRYPDSAFYMWTGAHSSGPVTRGPLSGYRNEQVDELIDEALLLAPEDERRCDLALEAQRLFMDDFVAMIYGVPDTYLNAREYVRNYERGPDRPPIRPWFIYLAEH